MSPGARQTLRIIIGFGLGFIGGIVLGIGLIILAITVCSADGGGFDRCPSTVGWKS